LNRRILIVSALLISGAIYLTAASRSEPTPIRRPLSELPNAIGMWLEDRSSEFDKDTLNVLGVNDYINRSYNGPNMGQVGLYIGYYVSQRQGGTIHSPLNCLPGSGWNPIEKDILNIPIPSDFRINASTVGERQEIRINRIVIQKEIDKQVVLYWYHSHGRVIASEYLGKIFTVLDALRSNRTDAALVRVISPVNGQQESAQKQAEEQAIDFVKALFPMLGNYLPE
jgi:EpsI family protein